MAARRLGDYILRYLGLGGATGDATNPLSVRGPGALFDGNTGGHQIRVNKAAVGDTASYLFQTGFSGRAEFGTLGSDNFGLKVSADGSEFTDVFTVSGTGSATFRQDTLFSGGVGIGGASPDSTNRLSVNTEAALFNNAGSDIRFTMNKAAVGDDAALTFQDGFSTRALIGLLANDDFTLKTSPDGSTFTEALKVSATGGYVTNPTLPAFCVRGLSGTSIAPLSPWTSDLENTGGHFNKTNGKFTAPVSGKYFFICVLLKNSSTSDTNVTSYFRKNGAILFARSGYITDTTYNNVITQQMIYLNAGDYVDLQLSADTIWRGGDINTFSGWLIG